MPAHKFKGICTIKPSSKTTTKTAEQMQFNAVAFEHRHGSKTALEIRKSCNHDYKSFVSVLGQCPETFCNNCYEVKI